MSQEAPPRAGSSPWQGRGLLEQIAETALDDDYYVYRGSQPRPSWRTGIVVGLVVTLFAMLVTTAAVQTRNDRPATELERRTLAADIEAIGLRVHVTDTIMADEPARARVAGECLAIASVAVPA